MAVLSIPEEHRAGLAMIASLSEAEAVGLISALAAAPAIRPPHKLVSRIETQAKIPRTDLKQIIDTLLALYAVRSNNEIPSATFTQDVCDAMRIKDENSLALDDPTCEILQRRLSVLMSLDSLWTTSKAAELQFEHERVFDRSRILTDIRAVFGDTTDDVRGAVISHELCINYIEGSELKEIYFSLDEGDLVELRKNIERALGKMRTLERLIERAGVKDLDSHDEEAI